MRKPKLIISKCLNSEKCRYNGQAYDDKVISLLRKYVDLETVCPETEIGLKVPRNPIRIEKYDNKYKLVEPSDNIDYTSQMMEFAEEFLSNIDDVDGFILKSKSPSCGIRDVKVYPKNQKCSINKKGQGIFSSKIIEKYSTIPIEDEGRLKNYNIRDEFLTKIFTINNLKCENSILDFHNKNSLLLKSYNEDIYNDLNIIVSKENMDEDDKTLYKNKVYEILNNKRDKSKRLNLIKNIFEKYTKEGYDVICITGSSKASGTFQSANLAKADVEGNIYIFDSLFLSLGSGQYVIKASHLIEEGNLNASEIIQELENMRKDVNLLFVPFTLEYLKQSGRLPSVVSFVGNMLSIKPICTMEDGKNKIVSKVRGTKQIASKLVDMILELNDGNVEDKIITIGYGSNEDDFKRLQEEVSKKINAKKIYITRGGSCICSHTGPEILAISSSY